MPLSSLTIYSYIFVSTLLALAPGPDNIFVITQSAIYGVRQGLMITLGLCSGLVLHTLIVTFGIAAIIQQSETLFLLIKWLGVLYLIYISLGQWNSKSVFAYKLGEKELTKFSWFRKGFVMNILNPKVSMFFIAYLPQFLELEKGSITLQIITLGALFGLVTICVFSSFALLSSRLNPFLNRSPVIARNLNKVSAVIIAALAIYLGLA